MSDGAPFVAREPEIDRLTAFLNRAVAGEGQICLVTGEAGTGKSALVAEFEHRAQAAQPALLLAVGQCDPQLGTGLPFAPFREVIEDLTDAAQPRGVSKKVAQENTSRLRRALALAVDTVINFGPDLVETVVPGSNLALKIGKYVAEKAGWKDKLNERIAKPKREQKLVSATSAAGDRVPEQYVNILRALAEKAPLLIVIEDVHWADADSCDVLARLSRRLSDRRILVICTLREHDVQVTRGAQPRPIDHFLSEIKRDRGDVFIDLDRVRRERARAFIDLLLDAQPNRLDEQFRANLLGVTDGHPLFTVELLGELKRRGDVEEDAQGRWCAARPIDWAALPAKVEGVIETRLRALSAQEQQLLDVASVEGAVFTAEVIARVNSVEPRAVVRELSGDLRQVHQLVEAMASSRVGQQRLSSYAFAHNLFQRYLYSRLDAAELPYLHESVGLALESLYGAQAAQVAPQLARHFELAGVADKARTYLRRAAEQAAAGYANDAALDLYARALSLADEHDIAERYDIVAGRERVFDRLGRRDAQKSDLAQLGQWVDALPDAPVRRAELALRRARLALDLSDYARSMAESEHVFRVTEADSGLGAAASFLRVDALIMCARVHGRLGEAGLSAMHLEEALAIAERHGYASAQRNVLELIAYMKWSEGRFADAVDDLQRVLQLSVEAHDRVREWNAHNGLGLVLGEQRDFAPALDHLEQARAITRQIGDRLAEARVQCNVSATYLDMNDFERALGSARQALDMATDVAETNLQTAALINLGEARLGLGDFDGARADLALALSRARQIGYTRASATALEGLGRVALATGDGALAEDRLEQALGIARDIGARMREGTSLLYLGRALAALGRVDRSSEAFARALSIWTELKNDVHAAHARAGLAGVELRRGGDAVSRAYEHARGLIDAILSDAPPDWVRFASLFVFHACEAVLHARSDSRAGRVRECAGRELDRRAQAISDAAWRESFVNAAQLGV